ncbi:uncharacterized protein BXZ73DRAFT_100958 [Epithele typhae]|uniref:uncharacterized protein n=1 Tax=Epithele typhae TaxID=378194 RepID=UPI0020078607|nr:uncharacterized protein BXZ73DRAFT_100958 [Epithele typhae]KAH9933573.1 hypothetical protein BXZ73DRAFT_100958 [Epithele typhae]
MSSTHDDQSALFVGTFFSVLFYGIFVHQSFAYFRSRPQDGTYAWFSVLLTLFLETLHVALAFHTCFTFFVNDVSDPGLWKHGLWSLKCLYVIGACVMIVTQTYILRRLSLMGNDTTIVALVALVLFVAKFGLVIALTIRIFTSTSPHPLVDEFTIVVSTQAVAVAVDALVSGTIVVVLHRGRTAQRQMSAGAPDHDDQEWVDRSVLYGLNSGVLIGILDTLTLVLAVAFRDTPWWSAANQITVKLYAITLLSVLHVRKPIDTLVAGVVAVVGELPQGALDGIVGECEPGHGSSVGGRASVGGASGVMQVGVRDDDAYYFDPSHP